MPHDHLRPDPEGCTYSFDQAPRAEDLTLEVTAARRWPLWLARLLCYAALAAALPGLVKAVTTTEGRELLLVSVVTFTVILALFLVWAHETINKDGKTPRTRVMKSLLTFGASCVSVGTFLIGTQADPAHIHTKAKHVEQPLPASPDAVLGLAIHDDHVGLLPRFSARMTGATQAPVSLVFLGSGTDLLETFHTAGWHAAERITPRTALRAFGRGVLNRPYHCAPVFPSFLDGNLHDVAFQKTDPGSSSRRRHHARWWLTEYTCEDKQVWVATASYDAGVGVGRLFPMPIHHIDPDIDAERDYIARDLTGTGIVRVTQELRVTEPMTGRNAAGDRFYTRGIAYVLA